MSAPHPFVLTDAQFAGLAAGRPAAAAVAVLRRARLSRHLLLIREIARAAPGAGLADLAAAERTDPAGVRRLLADPLTGLWAAGCLAALRRGEPPDSAGAGHLAAGRAGRPVGRRLRARHGGLSVDVRLEDADPLRARLGLTPAGRLPAAELERWRELFAAAWRLLVSRHRAGAELVAAVLEVIVPVEPDPAARGISATAADGFGAVALSVPADATALAVGLLHETMHSLLNAVGYLFDLHRDPGVLGYSPWRDDPRPASGVLHGAYAYLAVTRFWRSERAAGSGDGLAAFEFARWRQAVTTATRGLLEAGGLTAAGGRFAGALLDEVTPWLDEAVPEPAARLAEGANADHHLRWRLRHLAVDPADVRDLADRWRRGLPPPATPVRSRLVPAPRRALENSPRLALAHARMRGGPGRLPGGRASAGDAAYLGGDHATAAVAYEKRVVGDPFDDAAWAGLALVRGWRDVEVVAAVRRSLGAGADPGALAAWIPVSPLRSAGNRPI